jgi:hypothetical protein
MIKTVVHNFRLGDVEDPEIYVAEPIYQWQQTDAGRWVMEHSQPKPEWTLSLDANSFGYRVHITATFSDKDATYFLLKYNTPIA